MKFLSLFLLLTSFLTSFSNKPSSEIYVDLQKFHSLKKMLYIAAHPDDENTRALAWFSLGQHARTAYLSLTRGDGGQNLIGNEMNGDLGVLRTHELLAARSYDKAEQYFSKAVDFGYSKSAEESFEKWGKDDILEEVVLMIRQFKPDVIITRFPADERGGHGHHIASTILALEAFGLAANPDYLPQQVEKHGVWQTKSIYWNASSWANPNIAEDAKNNPEYLIKNIGEYNELLGMSYNEIGTIARSQHKCQGFGALIEKGSHLEYFEYLGGIKLKEDFFENNTETWRNLLGKKFQKKLETLLANFNYSQPERNLPALLRLKTDLEKLSESSFKEQKTQLLNQIITDCLGLDVEVVSNDYAFALNEKTMVDLNVINRSNTKAELIIGSEKIRRVKILPKGIIITEKIELENSTPPTVPYWLQKPYENTYVVEEESDLLKAKNDATFSLPIEIKLDKYALEYNVPVEHKWRDPAYGERRRETISSPTFTANFNSQNVILQANQSKIIELKVHGFKENIQDKIILEAPHGWMVAPLEIPIELKKKHDKTFINIKITATSESERGYVKLKNAAGEDLMSYTEIAYDHIPTQTIFRPSSLECVKLDAQIKLGKVAYIKGVDDGVPEAISQLGFEVEVIETKDLSSVDFTQFQTIVLGIRVYNIQPDLKNFEDKLLKYIEGGGNLVMQYNTVSRWGQNEKFGGPLPFEITMKRVTEEDAAVKFLNPNHPLLNFPNKISQADFDNWVQERGLYFAGNWSESFEPLFSWSDKGEEEQLGSLIVSKYGKGQFIYTGISFFRELPAGVEGAYRLFANLLSYPHE